MAQNTDANAFIETFKKIFISQYCIGDYKPAEGVSYGNALVDTAKKSFVGRMSKQEYLYYIVPGIILSLIPVVNLAFILPNCSTTARRLHDLNLTGWLCLIMILPIIRICLMVYLVITDGKPEANQFGEPPAA